MSTTVIADARDRAFERMYQRYVRDVYRYALALLRNPADAEDVTQTTFLNAYRAFKAGSEPLRPHNWLIAIAHNACRTRAIRASRRPKEVPLDEIMERLTVPEHDKPNVRELLGALGRLPFNQRAAIAMRELEGRSYHEIAGTLGVSVPAVEALISRARRNLRLQGSALRGIAVVQLPQSLRSLVGNGEVASAGGAIVGGGVLAKAAAVLVAGVVAGGMSYMTVEAGIGRTANVTRPEPGRFVAPTTAPAATRSAGPAAVMTRPRVSVAAVRAHRRVGGPPPAVTVAAPGSSTPPSVESTPPGVSTARQSTPTVTQPGAPAGPAATVPTLPVPLPEPPPAPTLPAVTAPAPPALPPVPTVPTVTVPQPLP